MPVRAIHERSHSDTPTSPLPSVDLSVESSSVTTFRDLPLRKSVTSGKFLIFLINIFAFFIYNKMPN